MSSRATWATEQDPFFTNIKRQLPWTVILRLTTCLLPGGTPSSAAQCRHCSAQPPSAVSHLRVLYDCQSGSCQTVTALAMTSWVTRFQVLAASAAHVDVNHSPAPESSRIHRSLITEGFISAARCAWALEAGWGRQSWTFLSWHFTPSSCSEIPRRQRPATEKDKRATIQEQLDPLPQFYPNGTKTSGNSSLSRWLLRQSREWTRQEKEERGGPGSWSRDNTKER